MVIKFFQYGEVDALEWTPARDEAYRLPAIVKDPIPPNCQIDDGLYQRSCWDDVYYEISREEL